ncbi:MAG: NAD(P)-dependent glycerol-3-phosphate dehydrogenase [Candidatus Omnitrophica bacterium]|nr:NAD(P)-dependent glycerol-3-phosphate dehydrogenase [Candidatus Omnitrophota bacterium]
MAVLGDGGWGTTLAIHLHRLGHRVRLWGAFPEYVALLRRRRVNPKFLPGIPLPKSLRITADLREAAAAADIIVLATPSQHLRSIAKRLGDGSLFRVKKRAVPIVVSVAKGIEQGSLKRMSQVLHEELGPGRLAVLSGPNIAKEIATGHPASSVVASHHHDVALRIQQSFMSDRLRLYTSTDVIGVELGGALKNPIAIAAGISDGLGFGANAKAALVTRGIVEMARVGVAMGARAETFWGLSGRGDLVTTCLSGRNRWLGEQLGQGKRLRAVLASTPMVIEGVETSTAAVALAHRHHVEVPIIEQVHAILFRRRAPRAALSALMRRSGKSEAL